MELLCCNQDLLNFVYDKMFVNLKTHAGPNEHTPEQTSQTFQNQEESPAFNLPSHVPSPSGVASK